MYYQFEYAQSKVSCLVESQYKFSPTSFPLSSETRNATKNVELRPSISGRVTTFATPSAGTSTVLSFENFSLISRFRTFVLTRSPLTSLYWLFTIEIDRSSYP